MRNNLLLATILLGCTFSRNTIAQVRPGVMDLSLPLPDTTEKNIKASLTLVLLKDSIAYYPQNKFTSAKMIAYGDRRLRAIIANERKKIPAKDFVIIIKATNESTYRNSVDILDEMSINKVTRYSMVRLSKEEEMKFGTTTMLPDPPDPVKVDLPSTVSSNVKTPERALIIELKNDQSVWYYYSFDTLNSVPGKIEEPAKENLSKVIAAFKKESLEKGILPNFQIKGHMEVKYTLFENVIAALRENNQFKYTLIAVKD